MLLTVPCIGACPVRRHTHVAAQPSGRFETGKKICLSISGFHPEFWQVRVLSLTDCFGTTVF